MKNTIALVIATLASVALAAPAQKRGIVWVTDYKEVVETTIVVTTVYVPGPVGAVPTSAATTIDDISAPDNTSAAQAAAVEPSPSSVTSEAAPAPIVTSAAVKAPVAETPAAAPSSSVYEAPSVAPPAPPVAAASIAPSSAAPAPSPAPSTSAGGSSSGGSYSGDLTWYDVGQGSCGLTSTAGEPVVALSHVIMTPANPGNPNNNPYCGKKINITYKGKTTQATVADTCQGCDEGSIDVSTSLFTTVAGDLGLGRVSDVQWSFAS